MHSTKPSNPSLGVLQAIQGTAVIEHVERAAIQRALLMTDGRLDEAAKMLGLSRKGLYLKRQRLKLG